MNVLAGLHPLDGLPLELHCVTTPLCHPGHFASPFAAKCVFSACLTLGGHSITQRGLLQAAHAAQPWVGSAHTANRSQAAAIQMCAISVHLRLSVAYILTWPQ